MNSPSAKNNLSFPHPMPGKTKESEEYFRKLSDIVPTIIWITDPDGSCAYLNGRWYDYTGQTPEEAEGFGWLEATHPDDKDEATKIFIEANKTQTPFSLLYRLRTKTGEYRWCKDSGSPRFNKEGVFEGFIGTVTDVHEEKLAEEKIRQSEDRYRTLFNSIDAGFCTIEVMFDEQGNPYNYRFLEINQAFQQQTGLTNAVGKTMNDFAQIEDFWYKTYADVAITGKPVRFENRAENLHRFYDVYAFKIDAPEDRKVAVLFTDITQRNEAELALKESEARFRALVNATSEVVYRMSADWSVMRNLEGRGFLSDTGKPIHNWSEKYIHPKDRQRVEIAINKAIQEKSKFELEHQVVKADGTLGWTFSRAIPILDDRNNIMEWFGAASDITERKNAENALQQSESRYKILSETLEHQITERTKELQRSNEDLQQFAHVASHDLKEPVRKVKIFASLLEQHLNGKLNESQSRFIERIHSAADRMFSMIDGVLTYSTMNASKQKPHNVDLNELMKNIETDLEVSIQKKGAQFSYNNLPVIEGAPVFIYQLFYNLITNSIKFSKADVAPQISITSESVMDNNRKFVKLVLSDNGIGFEKEHGELIFNNFTRLNAKDKYEGTGLGLSLCQKIVERHGGRISASGIPGMGASFTIILPIQQNEHGV
jgi:PAS domain S-box-containing protein